MVRKATVTSKEARSERGFTLIEVIIAMAIFAIGFLAVTSMQIRSINHNASARLQTEATTLAVDWMERLLAAPYDDLADTPDDTPNLAQSGSFTIQWWIETVKDLPIKQITIEVSNANPNSKTVELVSFKGRGET